MLEFGFSKECITPQLPIALGGYADREGEATGVHDDLYVRASYLKAEGKQCILLAFDLLMMDDAYYQPIQKEIAEALKIPSENVLIATTHTHSAPLFIRQDTFGKVSKSYFLRVKEAAVLVAAKARGQKQPVKTGWSQKKFSGVGRSRRSGDREGDVVLTLLSFVDLKEKPVATIINYNCHPTVLSAANREVSAEYPGAVIRALEETHVGEFLFVNGAAGDVSTRFVRKEQSFEEMERLGRLLANEVGEALEKMQYREVDQFSVLSREITPQVKVLPSLEALNQMIRDVSEKEEQLKQVGADSAKLRLVHTQVQGAHVQKMLSEVLDELDQVVRMTAVSIGEGALVFVNAEWFSGPAARVMEGSPYTITGIVGYTNGIVGYFPDRLAFEEGGYEALSCRFAPGVAEAVEEEGRSLLEACNALSE
jgi:hypothetical protein